MGSFVKHSRTVENLLNSELVTFLRKANAAEVDDADCAVLKTSACTCHKQIYVHRSGTSTQSISRSNRISEKYLVMSIMCLTSLWLCVCVCVSVSSSAFGFHAACCVSDMLDLCYVTASTAKRRVYKESANQFRGLQRDLSLTAS